MDDSFFWCMENHTESARFHKKPSTRNSKVLINKSIVWLQDIWHRICDTLTNKLKGELG